MSKEKTAKTEEASVKAKIDPSGLIASILALGVQLNRITYSTRPLELNSSWQNWESGFRNNSRYYKFYGYNIKTDTLQQLHIAVSTIKHTQDLTRVHPMFGPMEHRTTEGVSETVRQWYQRTQPLIDIFIEVCINAEKSEVTIYKIEDFTVQIQKELQTERERAEDWFEKMFPAN